MGAGGRLENTGDDSGTTSRADGCGHEGALEEDAIGCELIDGGSVVLVDGIGVAAHVRREVFDKDPEDIRAFFF